MKTRVSIKTIKGDVLQEVASSVYLNNVKKTLTLHYNVDEPIGRLLTLSINNGLELYRYADDKHIGITIPFEQIFRIEYIND